MRARKPKHGSRAAFLSGCRCERCMNAKAHGTLNGYAVWHCRCDRCREAASVARKRERPRVRKPLTAKQKARQKKTAARRRARQKALYEKQFNSFHADRLRQRKCDGIVTEAGLRHAIGCPELTGGRRFYRCDPSHVKSRGAGGKWFQIVSHSRWCHNEFGELPVKERKRMLPLAASLALESHQLAPDEVPAPPSEEGE